MSKSQKKNKLDLTAAFKAIFGTTEPKVQAPISSIGGMAERKAIEDFMAVIKIAEPVLQGEENINMANGAIIKDYCDYNPYDDYNKNFPETNKILNKWTTGFKDRYCSLVKGINPLTLTR